MTTLDAEIKKYVSLLGNEQKRSLLNTIKSLLNIVSPGKNNKPDKGNSSIDYSQFNFPASAIKFDRDEINER